MDNSQSIMDSLQGTDNPQDMGNPQALKDHQNTDNQQIKYKNMNPFFIWIIMIPTKFSTLSNNNLKKKKKKKQRPIYHKNAKVLQWWWPEQRKTRQITN